MNKNKERDAAKLAKAEIAKCFTKAAKRFCGAQKVSLDNSRHVLTVANMAAEHIYSKGYEAALSRQPNATACGIRCGLRHNLCRY